MKMSDLSRNEKIALAYITREIVTASKQVADYVGIKESYANNILTKLTKLGLIQKRYIASSNVVIPILTPDDKFSFHQIVTYGLLKATTGSFPMREKLSKIAGELFPTYISPPEDKKVEVLLDDEVLFCQECGSICQKISYCDKSGYWCNCDGYVYVEDRGSFYEEGKLPQKFTRAQLRVTRENENSRS